MSKTKKDPRLERQDDHRVVVTGMSALTAVGHTVASTWENLIEARSGIARITLMDASPYGCQIAGEVKDFNPDAFIPRKKSRHMAFSSKYAIITAGQAIEDSNLDLETLDLDNVGVIIGTAGGSTTRRKESFRLSKSSDFGQTCPPTSSLNNSNSRAITQLSAQPVHPQPKPLETLID